jgi:hypothetical protein
VRSIWPAAAAHNQGGGRRAGGAGAGFVAILVAAFVAPLNLDTVIIASLIVLLPGMSLTNAVNELTSQHLVSGTARFAGANHDGDEARHRLPAPFAVALAHLGRPRYRMCAHGDRSLTGSSGFGRWPLAAYAFVAPVACFGRLSTARTIRW